MGGVILISSPYRSTCNNQDIGTLIAGFSRRNIHGITFILSVLERYLCV